MQALQHHPEKCFPAVGKATLVDPFGRSIEYLRLAITDRCNLRCRYCMPAEGIATTDPEAILSFEEIIRLVRVAANCGISKIRFTGGEPFVRKDFMTLLETVHTLPGIESIHITSNGVALRPHIPRLKELGIAGVNLSLDTLRAKRFAEISRRPLFHHVQETLNGLLEAPIPVKINVVVQQGINTDELAELAGLARQHPVSVRFIEQMPFNGAGIPVASRWNSKKILKELGKTYPAIHRALTDTGTARIYTIPGFAGSIGLIGAYSRQFCPKCNKIRVTPQGILKTCLYDNGALDLKTLLRRETTTDSTIRDALHNAIARKPENGYIAEEEAQGMHASMASIGG